MNKNEIIGYIITVLENEGENNKAIMPVIDAIISEVETLGHKDEYGMLCMPVLVTTKRRSYGYEDITKIVVKCITALEGIVNNQVKNSVIYKNTMDSLKNYIAGFSITSQVLLNKCGVEECSSKDEAAKETKEAKEDVVNHPKHYRKGSQGLECIESMKKAFSEEEYKGFLKLNAYKYAYRFADKNGLEDLKKAEFYLKQLFNAEVSEDYKKQRENLYTVVLNVHKRENYKDVIKGMVLENIIKEDYMIALVGVEMLMMYLV